MSKCLLWFRRDLRIEDHPALLHASEQGMDVVAVYLHSFDGQLELNEGAASQWWLHHALVDFQQRVESLGGSLLILESDNPTSTLQALAREYDAEDIFWSRRYEPKAVELDTQLKTNLQDAGYRVESFNTSLFNEPHEVQNKSGKPFQVFTPFWKHCVQKEVKEPYTPTTLRIVDSSADSLCVDDLKLLPTIPWDVEFYSHWVPTRAGAMQRLEHLIKGVALTYSEDRDTPSVDGTSSLSAWLHFGQIGVREIYQALKDIDPAVHVGFIRQLYWRDFAHHLMFHFPYSVKNSLRSEYDVFPWQPDEEMLSRWREGKTGYPIIDAGMRQLWKTGWMHNRVRMIVASFLVKHLLQDWREGECWFWDTLLDADLANNVMGWQWCAGSGADAAPYFRIFNPLTQGEKFDPEGAYVREYLPELSGLPNNLIHRPWEAEPLELKGYGVTLYDHSECDGSIKGSYPKPVIELKAGRDRALAAYQEYKKIKDERS